MDATTSSAIISEIRAELERFIREPPDKPAGVAEVAQRTQVLPALYDWTAFGGISTNGDTVWVEYDPPYAVRPAGPAYERNRILHRLAERYPSLAALEPVRPQDAIVCSSCHGTGVIRVQGVARPEFSCWCGGLGWLPAGTNLPRRDAVAERSGGGGWLKKLITRVRRLTRA